METKVKKVSSYQGNVKGVKTTLHTYVLLDATAEAQYREDQDLNLEKGCPVFDGKTAESLPFQGRPRFTSQVSDLTEINRFASKDANGNLTGAHAWNEDRTLKVALNSEYAQLAPFIQAEMAREAIAEAKQRAQATALAIRLQRAKAIEADLKK